MLAAACCYAAVKVRSSTLRYHAADEIAVAASSARRAARRRARPHRRDERGALLPEQVGGFGEPVDAVASELATWAALTPSSSTPARLVAPSGAGATWFQSNGQRKASAKAQLWL